MMLKLIDRHSSGFSYICTEDANTVGRVHVEIKGNEALKLNIKVFELNVRKFSFIPCFKKTISFRNCGYGTALLKASIDRCRDIDITVIRGVMYGDIDRLSKWYSKNGFKVSGNDIILYL